VNLIKQHKTAKETTSLSWSLHGGNEMRVIAALNSSSCTLCEKGPFFCISALTCCLQNNMFLITCLLELISIHLIIWFYDTRDFFFENIAFMRFMHFWSWMFLDHDISMLAFINFINSYFYAITTSWHAHHPGEWSLCINYPDQPR